MGELTYCRTFRKATARICARTSWPLTLVLVLGEPGSALDGSLLMVAVAAAGAWAAWRLCFWIRQGRRMRISGHLPPPPSLPARLVTRAMCRALVALFVGPLEILNRGGVPRHGRILV